MNKSNHEIFMRRCFELAKKALGNTTPNPYVGSVIVRDGKIISEGYHRKAGLPHAELDAIQNAEKNGVDIKGATLYCNLEPCCHTNKKTPPCAQRIVKEEIAEVIICNLDPNPAVAGNGVKILEDAGIKVTSGILESEGLLLNEVFFTHITKKRPFIHLKWAQTLDGKVATNSFDSKWITNEKSRENAHKERKLYDAILVGANTVNQDDPSLTIRLNGTLECKKRIIISPSGNLKTDSKLFTDEFRENSILITGANNTQDYEIRKLACELDETGKSFDLTSLLEVLYREGVHSIYIEGGSKLLGSFLENKLFDRVSVYIAPKILGAGVQHLDHIELDKIKDAIQFSTGSWNHFGSDILFESQRNICLQD